MQQIAAVRSLKQASRVIKQMEHPSPEWMPDLRDLGRKALRRVLQQPRCGAIWPRRHARGWPIDATGPTRATS